MSTTQQSGSTGRGIVAGILLALTVLLTIPAVITGWARDQVLDTDQFVTTLAPLADEPDVQQMVTDQVMAAIGEQVDLSGLGGTLESWNLPPSAEDLLEDLVGTAAEKVRSLIETSVHSVVTSDAFAVVWSTLLEQAHTRAVTVMENDRDSALSADEHGTLWLDLGPVIEQVKADLTTRGIPFAGAIPQIDHSVPLLTSDSINSARFWYQLSSTLGAWLPWIMLALTAAGVLIARRRLSALARTALGCAGMLGVLLVILWFVRRGLIDEVSPEISARTAGTIFDKVAANLYTSTVVLLGIGIAIAAGAKIVERLLRPRDDVPPGNQPYRQQSG